MKDRLLLIFIIICVILGICLFCFFIDWIDSRSNSSHAVNLKFKEFKNYYSINPGKWDINGISPCYGKRYSSDHIYINLSFIDWIRYMLFINNIEKHNETIARAETMEKLTKSIMNDIEIYKKKNFEK